VFLIPLVFPLLGCTLFGQVQVVVTATPSLIPPTATPAEPTATPTIPPTPTPAPNVAIDQADRALRNGDYGTAVTVYNSIITQDVLSVDPRLRADAVIGMGTAALREGRFEDAVTALTEFITRYTDDPRHARAYFLRGDAYLGLSRWQDAINDFTTFLQMRPGLLDSYAHERIGDAHLALENPSKSLEHYDLAANSNASRGLVPLLVLREKVAAAHINAGNIDAAVAQYDAILEVARNPVYRATIALTAANLLSNAGNTSAALARYQTIFNEYPETPQGYTAMGVLLRSGTNVDSLLRGRVSFAAEDYNDAIAALYEYTSNTALTEIDPFVFIMLGQAYRQVGNIPASNTSFQTVLTNYPTSQYFGDAWLEQGRTLFLANDIQGAINKYTELSEKHPDVSQGAEALWRAGYLYSTLGNTEQSLATFEILGNKYPGTEWATDGLFRGAMAAYSSGALGRAQRLFALLATNGTGDLQAAGYLWLGRLYQLDGKDDLARQAYQEASQIDPGGYYSLRAADLLAGNGPFVPPESIDWSYNDPLRVAEAEQWMRQTFQITQSGDLWVLPDTLNNDPRMIRGVELMAVAAYDEAEGEFQSLTEDNETNPLALYQLASFYSRIGLHRFGIEAAAKLIDMAKIPTVNAPKYIAALRFPIAYYDLVLPETEKYGLDALLVFSLMRQESLFEGFATSSAQAQGLMQIIPDTGRYIAVKVGRTDYTNSDLYRPYVNVPFGVYYLQEQLQTFNGNVYAALAAYNAGPGASAEWMRISGGDPDLFLHTVAYDETKTYIRRIYEQYEIYRAIYVAR
jgi:soluble lytic murein transglycosylase